MHSIYECRYADIFRALTELYPLLTADRWFSAHAPWYLREMRKTAYNQFLSSYKSVTLQGMAAAFGVSTTFLDAELAKFISAGKLPAKIDAISGVIETTRPDSKNAQYLAVIKQGDTLLTRIQKLSRVVAL